jgi:hypothetical protein
MQSDYFLSTICDVLLNVYGIMFTYATGNATILI